jgi:hypothetical protein
VTPGKQLLSCRRSNRVVRLARKVLRTEGRRQLDYKVIEHVQKLRETQSASRGGITSMTWIPATGVRSGQKRIDYAKSAVEKSSRKLPGSIGTQALRDPTGVVAMSAVAGSPTPSRPAFQIALGSEWQHNQGSAANDGASRAPRGAGCGSHLSASYFRCATGRPRHESSHAHGNGRSTSASVDTGHTRPTCREASIGHTEPARPFR